MIYDNPDLAGRLAVNRTDIPAPIRAVVMSAMHAQMEYALALSNDEETTVPMRTAQVAEAELCDAIATLNARAIPEGATVLRPMTAEEEKADRDCDVGSDL